MRRMPFSAALVILLGALACAKPATQPPPGGELQGGGAGPDTPPPSDDPCANVELPACPGECTQPPGQLAGTECTPDGTKCGNSIGDGCECTAGKWACTVHKPLGGPGVCNLVCR